MKITRVNLAHPIKFGQELTKTSYSAELGYAFEYDAPFLWIRETKTGLEHGVPLTNVVSVQRGAEEPKAPINAKMRPDARRDA